MPLTPFIGLSVIIHLIIILGYKLFSFLPKNKRVRYKNKSILWTHIKSVTIVVAVFAFVTIQAGLLVRASIADKHSSLKYISKFATDIGESINKEKPKIIAFSKIITKPNTKYKNPIVEILKKTETNNKFIYQIDNIHTP